MIEVTFRDRRTNETIVRSLVFDWQGDDPAFWWREGNGGCDGNRSLYMYDYDNARYICCDSSRNLIEIDGISHEGAVVYQDAPEVRGDGSEADQLKAQLDGAVRQISNVQAALIDTTLDLATELNKARAALASIAGAEKAQGLLPMAQSIIATGERILTVFSLPDDGVSLQSEFDTLDGATNQLLATVEPLL